MREGNGGGREMKKAEARGGLPVGSRKAVTALEAKERCVVAKRRRWR